MPNSDVNQFSSKTIKMEIASANRLRVINNKTRRKKIMGEEIDKPPHAGSSTH